MLFKGILPINVALVVVSEARKGFLLNGEFEQRSKTLSLLTRIVNVPILIDIHVAYALQSFSIPGDCCSVYFSKLVGDSALKRIS